MQAGRHRRRGVSEIITVTITKSARAGKFRCPPCDRSGAGTRPGPVSSFVTHSDTQAGGLGKG
eukprot:760593-Hanusia_phi.AAC.7